MIPLMRYLLSLMIFVAMLSQLKLGAQTPSDSIEFEYIYVEKSTRKTRTYTGHLIDKKDFYRNKSLFRMPLLSSTNDKLLYAQPVPGSFEGQWGATEREGVVNLLLEGLKLREIDGYYPDNLRSGYDFDRLHRDLRLIAGIDSLQGRSMSLDELGVEWMSEYLDLIVEEGFSAYDSRRFIRIRFLRLIWHDPNGMNGPYAMVVFRYEDVLPLLDNMTIRLQNYHNKTLTVKDFFEQALYQAIPLKMSDQSLKYLDAPPRKVRVQEPELWKY